MATCVSTINSIIAINPNTGLNSIDTVTQITSNIDYSISFNNITKQILLIDTNVQQRATFYLGAAATTANTLEAAFTVGFYKYDNVTNTISLYGSTALTLLNNQFLVDLQAGLYLICISTTNALSYVGTFKGSFSGYPAAVRISTYFSHGDLTFIDNYMPPVVVPIKCNRRIFWTMAAGELPEGLSFSDGLIYGTISNLDCMMATVENSPSFNWWIDGDQNIPWGRRWNFKVKAWGELFEHKAIEEWFYIEVLNNWDKDRDNFLDKLSKTNIKVYAVEDPQEILRLESMCPPCSTCVAPTDETTKFMSPYKDSDAEFFMLPRVLQNKTRSEIMRWYMRAKDIVGEFYAEERTLLENLNNSKAFELFLKLENYIDKDDSDWDIHKYKLTTEFSKSAILINYKRDDRDFRPIDFKDRVMYNKTMVNMKHPYEVRLITDTQFEVTLS